MENQSTTLDKAVKISVIAGVLVVALSIAYYLVLYIPKQAQQQAQQKQANADNLAGCLATEKGDVSKEYEGISKLNREGKNIDVEAQFAKVDKYYESRKADCFKKYPQ